MGYVWVLWWKHRDGSGSGVCRAFASEERAQEDQALVLVEQGDKEWFVSCMVVYGEPVEDAPASP